MTDNIQPVEAKDTTTKTTEEKKTNPNEDAFMEQLAKKMVEMITNNKGKQEEKVKPKEEFDGKEKIWFDCRGEKIWTLKENIVNLAEFSKYLRDKNVVIELDENKNDIHNLFNYLSKRRYTDNDTLGDLLLIFGHDECINAARKIMEEKINVVSPYMSYEREYDYNKITFDVTDYPIYLTSILTHLLKKKYSKVTDRIVDDYRKNGRKQRHLSAC